MSNRLLAATLGTVKYWAGQKLLESPLHPYYLKLTGQREKPPTYPQWLASEATHLARVPTGVPLPQGYRAILPAGAQLAPTAGHWFGLAIAETGADLVYSDEDVMAVTGERSDPVFKPAWSPELFAHCRDAR